jgi:hypothetical protein
MITILGEHKVRHGDIMNGIADLMGNDKADKKLRTNIENRNAEAVDYRKIECPNCHKMLTIKSK